jgi:nitroreductase
MQPWYFAVVSNPETKREIREAAEQLYTEEWHRYIKDTYGSEPSVTYFESPVIVDNLSGSIITDD